MMLAGRMRVAYLGVDVMACHEPSHSMLLRVCGELAFHAWTYAFCVRFLCACTWLVIVVGAEFHRFAFSAGGGCAETSSQS